MPPGNPYSKYYLSYLKSHELKRAIIGKYLFQWIPICEEGEGGGIQKGCLLGVFSYEKSPYFVSFWVLDKYSGPDWDLWPFKTAFVQWTWSTAVGEPEWDEKLLWSSPKPPLLLYKQ